ncbi:hypothetical protein [Solirubrum puertoriconensis]|uniref:Uncharacterized protein n=1 Tax=Solirubrum puertoriconensis TaxID=1751427 RepID=A0A9X0HHS1_SOLP1|nr:hypothetical protein [Solirubrum puertoriconensis]KUG06151.1 hypothetical protein ASU33_01935 [Solirubrum puertoriconensis]
MKKQLLISLLLVFAAFGLKAQSVADLDAKNGFGNDVFGKSISAYPGMVCISKQKSEYQLYTRPTDDLSYGGGKLKGIVYGFYNGQLREVILTIDGANNAAPVLKALTAAYGPGTPGHKPNSTLWQGQKVKMECVTDSPFGSFVFVGQTK